MEGKTILEVLYSASEFEAAMSFRAACEFAEKLDREITGIILPKKFKYEPLQNRRYKLGKELKEGDRVWLRRSGAHYDILGQVVDGKIIVQNHHAIPEYLISASFGLWPNHKYLIATV